MDDAMDEAEGTGLRVAFDRRLKLEFHGATVTSCQSRTGAPTRLATQSIDSSIASTKRSTTVPVGYVRGTSASSAASVL